ncbi:Putative dual specificity protein phosphatase DSP8 [Zea mays]|uniref:Putative dual specificity protein phosphatase DSP8 n=1 Tax=Zea mays TaxID=4577 RepID=A0A1D6KY88_MAIZE|nr:Putative dual specificity protein phosphatase DSP8 [Zea mays]ONM07330.1 Putative dual specificity protein phosphatase DSP8 [Zea mays]ONM07333.1 Putative dual specificity protein phosphatase DSP8 [Zea mays]ONM07396.1 Putative dual specificity protein phosphatase DSP8 [Zea mays]
MGINRCPTLWRDGEKKDNFYYQGILIRILGSFIHSLQCLRTHEHLSLALLWWVT